MSHRTWDDDRHVLTAYATEDPDYPIEFEVEHPQSCKVYIGCSGSSRFWCEKDQGHHVHTYYDCPLGHEIEAIGPDEALFGLSFTGPKGYRLMEEPPENCGEVWVEARKRMDAGEEEFTIPMKIHWWGGTDYWGEWDHGFEIEVKDA
jgi:hypothetical protein